MGKQGHNIELKPSLLYITRTESYISSGATTKTALI